MYSVEKASINLIEPFEIITHSAKQTETALDLDYTWNFELRIDANEMKKIESEIRKTKFYNKRTEPFNTLQDSMEHYKLKGDWVRQNETYNFSSPNYVWKETTSIELKIKTKTLHFEMIHL